MLVAGVVALEGLSDLDCKVPASFARSKRRTLLLPICVTRSSSGRDERVPLLREAKNMSRNSTRKMTGANLQTSPSQLDVPVTGNVFTITCLLNNNELSCISPPRGSRV